MTLKRQYQIFIDEMIKHGNATTAYKVAYPKAKGEAARVNGYKLLQNATIAGSIRTESDKIKSEAQKQAILELKEEIKANILTKLQKQETLFKIVTGEHRNEIKKPVFNSTTKKFEIVTVHEPSDDIAIMKAIDLDNKMAGDYAPIKADVAHSFLDFLRDSE